MACWRECRAACLRNQVTLNGFLLERHAEGYHEIITSELPHFVQGSVALVFGRRLADTLSPRCGHAATKPRVDVAAREELVAPTCRFAMLYSGEHPGERWNLDKRAQDLRAIQEMIALEELRGIA